MNLPNKLTMFRIVISFFFLIFLFIMTPLAKTTALLLFIVGIVTDIFDGKIARKHGITTDLGKLLDPLADKILITSAFISFVQLDPIRIPAWMAALIVAREFSITGLRISALSKGKVIPADLKGKQKMISQTTTIILGLCALSYKEIVLTMSGNWNIHWDYWIGTVMRILTFLTVINTIATGLCYLWDNRFLFIEDK